VIDPHLKFEGEIMCVNWLGLFKRDVDNIATVSTMLAPVLASSDINNHAGRGVKVTIPVSKDVRSGQAYILFLKKNADDSALSGHSIKCGPNAVGYFTITSDSLDTVITTASGAFANAAQKLGLLKGGVAWLYYVTAPIAISGVPCEEHVASLCCSVNMDFSD
jgi:hypothetical protein